MKLTVNLRHLETDNLIVEGEIPPADMDYGALDDLIKGALPLKYRLEVASMDDALLVRGDLEQVFEAECARCLKRFPLSIALSDWMVHLPLEGEDAVPILGDCVDLTPFIREDIVLALPQHPLCRTDCRGLAPGSKATSPPVVAAEDNQSTWSVLDQLNLKQD